MSPETQQAGPLPEPLANIRSYLGELAPPAGGFDTDGEWTATYSIRLTHRAGGVDHCSPAGVMRAVRRPLGDGVTQITVIHEAAQGGPTFDRVEATLTCHRDELSTLRGWDSKTRIVRGDRVTRPGTEFRARGMVGEDGIVRISGGKRFHPTEGPVTSDWCLIDALQRTPFGPVAYEGFTVLEELDVPRTGQRLTYRGPVEVAMAGEPATLHGFERTGRGVLPTTYWLDEDHRMLFVVGALRSYLLAPDLEVPEVIE